jgi:phage baseplate assembly protein W
MAIDLYFKMDTYPYYDADEIEINDRVEMLLQELEMILTTPKGSVLGDPDFGVSLDSYIWTTSKGSSHIKQDVDHQINKYISNDTLNGIDLDIEVNFIKGEVWDTIYLDILIDGTKVAGYAVEP